MPAKKVTSNKTQVTSKPEAKVTAPVEKPVVKKTGGLSIPVYSLLGKETGTLDLPKEIFGVEVNKKLLSQALRVYSTNQQHISGSTKTRGEITASTAKLFRQKGTGRARHGSKKAPIFVGGGIAFGPRPRRVSLDLPKKMKKAALLSALSSKMVEKNVSGLIGLEKATGKTKEIAGLMEKIGSKNALIITPEKQDNVLRASRNIPGLTVMPVNQLNAYEVIKHKVLLVTKESVEAIVKGPKETK